MTTMQEFREVASSSVGASGSDRFLRAGAAVSLTVLAWLLASWMCLQALLLSDSTIVLRIAIVVGAAVPATGSLLVARAVLRLPAYGASVLLGLLPSLAGGYLLVSLL